MLCLSTPVAPPLRATPESRTAAGIAKGTLVVPLDQDFCWMWSNKTAQPVEIELQLTQAGNPRG
ncbi:MAG: hypothetical protein ABI790_15210 [Betaproteobacteria bacterium]